MRNKYHMWGITSHTPGWLESKTRNSKYWQRCREIVENRLLHCWWEGKMVQSLWETVWQFLKRLNIVTVKSSDSVSHSVMSDSVRPHGLYYSLPGSSAHGILQARILEWVAIFFSRGSSWTRDQTHTSCLAGGFFITKPPGKPLSPPVASFKCIM